MPCGKNCSLGIGELLAQKWHRWMYFKFSHLLWNFHLYFHSRSVNNKPISIVLDNLSIIKEGVKIEEGKWEWLYNYFLSISFNFLINLQNSEHYLRFLKRNAAFFCFLILGQYNEQTSYNHSQNISGVYC